MSLDHEIAPDMTCPTTQDEGATEKQDLAPTIALSDEQAEILARQIRESTPPKIGFRSLYKYATRGDLLIVAVSALCAVIAGAGMPIMSLIYGTIAGAFQGFALGEISGDTLRGEVSRLALYFVYLAIAEFVVIYVHTVGFHYTGERITGKIRAQYLASILRQNVAYFDKLGAGEVTTRVTTDTSLIQEGISGKVGLTIQAFATFIAAYVIGFVRYWKLTLILTSTIVAIAVSGGFVGRLTTKWNKESLAAYATGGTLAEEVIGSIRNAVAFGTQARLAGDYDAHLARAERPSFKMKAAIGSLVGLMMCYFYLTYALSFWLGSQYIASGESSLSAIITILLAILMGAFALENVAPNMQAYATAVAAATKIYGTIDRQSPIDATRDEGHIVHPSHLHGVVEFRDVRHIYPSRPDVVVLDSVSLVAPANKTTALVGSSGSGKSTIVDLVQRFYDPIEGEILFDGVRIQDLSLRWLRQQIGYVSQEPVLFATTIAGNIRQGLLGSEYEDLDDEDEQIFRLVSAAAKTANAHEFISDLPQGYQTFVGERGFLLSGGQKQRIAIARAIVGNPKVLLLDEATSALDSKSEGIVQSALDKASYGRTTITIAHRLSTINKADNIIVLKHGSIVEQGTHDELSARQTAYHNLLTAQGMTSLAEPESMAASEIGVSDSMPFSASQESVKGAGRIQVIEKGRDKNDSAKKYTFWRLVWVVMSLNVPDWPYMMVGVICAVICGGVIPVHSVLFAQSLSTVAFAGTSAGQTGHSVSFWTWMYFMLALVQLVAYLIQGFAFAYCSEKLVRRARLLCFRSILRQDIAFFDKKENTAGGLTSFLSSSTTDLAGISGPKLSTILSCLTTLTAGFIIALAIAWKLALVCISTVPVVFVCGFLRVWMLARFQTRAREAYDKSASYACEATSAIRTVASLTREEDVMTNYREQLIAQERRSTSVMLRSSALYATSQSLIFGVYALCFWYGGTLIAAGELSLLQFFLCFSAVIFGAQSSGIVFSFAPDLGKATNAAREMAGLLDRVPSIDTWSEEGEALTKVQGDVEFRGVHFRYPTRAHSVLRGLDLRARAGQYVGIVGASGCGKSTAIGLLERFYDPLAGQILVDGQNIANLNLNSYRRHIGLVSQEPMLYQGTIRDNVLLGVDDEDPVGEEVVVQACKDANIHDFIVSLPDGLDTDVGNKGVMLSGGQKQRIAIARALVRNPRILLLDEATSALDSESEQVVQAALDNAAQGRTTLAVAHRLSTIQRADVIFVLEDGLVAETGTHRELMSRRGKYFELVNIQAMASAG